MPKSEFVPHMNAANPGQLYRFDLRLAEGEQSPIQTIDLIQLLAECLDDKGFASVLRNSWLILDSELYLTPRILSLEDRVNGGLRAATTIQACHPDFGAQGIFEFLHSSGENPLAALRSGFDSWIDMDLPVLLDALAKRPGRCATMQMGFPAEEDSGPLTRLILFGSAGRYCVDAVQEEEGHPFCDCCLFTNSMEAFLPLLREDAFYAIRLFAARDPDGVFSADCRVNGEEWPEGAEALLQYAQTWPGGGFEYRKQYIAIKTMRLPAAEQID